MTKVIGKTVCTDCNKEHDVELELNDIELTQLKTPKVTAATIETNETPQEPKPKIKTEFKVPSYIPSASCKNGSCGKNHKNKNYQNAPNQKCENCGQFSFNAKSCPFCNNEEFEEIDRETLEDLGIPIPEEHDHDHELED